ncbi:MAG: hypothetical protein WA790_11910 [Sulfitobacter sp.]
MIRVSLRILLPFLAFSTAVAAEPCTQFEKAVFELADQSEVFHNSSSFLEYGWSKAGPTNGWLDRWQAIRDEDNALHLDFLRKYGFVSGDLYSLANAYRRGTYDSYYANVERDIKGVQRCEYE